MKNYEEMANSVFLRMEEYEGARKRRRTILSRMVISACCVLIVGLMGFVLWKEDVSNISPGETISVTSQLDVASTAGKIGETLRQDPEMRDSIIILSVDELPDMQFQNICLLWNDFVPMTPAELNAYYGIDVFPQVPGDLTDASEVCGIYRRDDGIYWDTNHIHYENSNLTRTLEVNVDKEVIPFDFCNLFDEIGSTSLINDTKVGIAQTPYGEFYAEFLYQGVGFRIVSTGLSQEELLDVIRSIIA